MTRNTVKFTVELSDKGAVVRVTKHGLEQVEEDLDWDLGEAIILQRIKARLMGWFYGM